MWIVQITGGLGNQMFQYAFGYALKKHRPDFDLKYDISYYDASTAIRKYALDIFGIENCFASSNDIRNVRGFFQYDNRIQRLVHGFLSKKNTLGLEVSEDLDSDKTDYLVEDANAYFSGYWQSERFFEDCKDEIRDLFKFPTENMSVEYKRLLDQIEQTNSVSIHVRLEDYLNEENSRVYGNICTCEYYEKAIKYMNQHHGNCTYFVFTTDRSKALEILPSSENYVFVDAESSVDYLEMYLMTKCKMNIIANSSFSWWGAWLNNNTDKDVICPNRWLNNHSVNKQICDSWIRI